MLNIDDIARCVVEIEEEFRITPGLILSEDDAKCLLFGKLQSCLISQLQHSLPTSDVNTLASPLHTEIKFLDRNGKLSIRPDLTLLDTNALCIGESRDGFSIDRKGFVFFGSALAIEIKFCKAKRGITNPFVASIRKDCEKLLDLQERLYPSNELPTFKGVAVVFSRRNRASQLFYDLQEEFAGNGNVQLLYATANYAG